MKIAVFLAEMPTPSETFVIQHIRALASRGHEVTVLAGSARRTDGPPGIDGIRYRHFRSGRARLGQASAVLRLLAVAPFTAGGRRRLGAVLSAARHRNLAPLLDVAQAGGHLGSYGAILAHFGPAGVRAMYLREAGLLAGPIATIFHGLDMSARPLIERAMPHYRRLFARTELLLPVSRLWADTLQRWGAPAQRVRVLHMGVDIPPSAPDTARPVGRPLRVISIARLVEKKGLTFAIAGIAQSGVTIDYKVVGYGPLDAELRAQAAGLCVNATFIGMQQHRRVLALLERSDVLLLPSVTAADGQMEGIPVVLIEAMARGVVVIATRHAGNPELIDDGHEGFLVGERDSDAIAGVLQRIAAGAENLAAIRRAARLKVDAEFNSETLANDLERLLLGMRNPVGTLPAARLRARPSLRRRKQDTGTSSLR